MNFEHLRTIIKNIKQQLSCIECGVNFLNEDIFVAHLQANKCVLAVKCHECKTPLMISASMTSGKIMNTEKEDLIDIIHTLNDIPEYTAEYGEVKVDDVVNIHEYLKDFSGDFTEVFEAEE